MVLTKEYRICMPISVDEYKIGQLYMIARHSLEQSQGGEGVEVVENKECEDEEGKHGKGQYTEKKIHLSSRLPYWLQAICPRVFYIIEKSWNYYPYTITEYACSFIPKFNIRILTNFKNDSGDTENSFKVTEDKLGALDVIDIAYDDLTSNKHYKEDEDPKFFKSIKTNRGPLLEGWRQTDRPIMCSYKLVNASFEVWGFQTKVEDYIHKCVRDVLLLGHRQAFAWIDEWFDMSMADVREYEKRLQKETNEKVLEAALEDDEGKEIFEDAIEGDAY